MVTALNDDVFSEKLALWKAANLIRFAGAMVGWLMVCYLTYKDAVFTVLVLGKPRRESATASQPASQPLSVT